MDITDIEVDGVTYPVERYEGKGKFNGLTIGYRVKIGETLLEIKEAYYTKEIYDTARVILGAEEADEIVLGSMQDTLRKGIRNHLKAA